MRTPSTLKSDTTLMQRQRGPGKGASTVFFWPRVSSVVSVGRYSLAALSLTLLHVSIAAALTVTSPSAGDVWPVGSVQTVRFPGNIAAFVDFYISRDGGSTFDFIDG